MIRTGTSIHLSSPLPGRSRLAPGRETLPQSANQCRWMSTKRTRSSSTVDDGSSRGHLPWKRTLRKQRGRGKSAIFSLNASIRPHLSPPFRAERNTKRSRISARLGSDSETTSNERQLNLSVLRFTFGISGLDESYLPRWIGYGFGSLLLLNHFVGSDLANITPAQLRTEVLGLSLAAFSIILPYLGKFLPGAGPGNQVTLPEGNEQLFVMSESLSDTLKENLAWATYVLLRNTNTIAVLISIRGELCIRGYWRTPDDVSKGHVLDWFEEQIQKIGLSDLKDTLYFTQSPDFGFRELLPNGTRSLLVQPLLQVSDQEEYEMGRNEGFVVLFSSMSYAYSDKDRAWIKAVANKFTGRKGRNPPDAVEMYF
ncbi:protein COFACTOR ASSEMBLY OF COMPLEX C SUBUNIT B CCB2, chloroplastic isoform X1 [Rhodamnia argentea]|uniref:Protein COFACTOR ASSEMBLY OF COMPLEX C SUBUNIT B CCB2, chloroplastic isoform X1 n=1 Tax=Rhodamnia argentea TaxID=178133 RepID=A0ABM3HP52_9MYRT|nr:protein COFACTOR ASSEMBLY OF COMPLEX C SUBUNIT B CCB2, chloroplastic isoform X1 [Rhodamnia argentea]XP_048138368.1 protein COFACTOR ASSEMBLY OF COMPLEX C SUBUNIT B CCB2, chloroplastic isoform X1 [Rhodamnia argentea]XP_048138369.1 protein COFACTOR ASSEMBLY OF COMPLEX C SUBUNIT B CCB2, chloroplastic isoform X1 [Rhodamnia argentea]XP_048138370.1 protein COFACTOR ASSEMBLY OF COMPLEX C SUBUNIT B CCB2, chloroplastic isoform X1 [Rhodamnia argentea]XP_048138371.1 protein COFACTOR ASSEMBLY OF COMPLEX